jgi:predicted enzyme related to lactoylglutathione lyase
MLPGTVIFTHDKERLARFYQALSGWAVTASDDVITVLRSEHAELVLHRIPAEYGGAPDHDAPAPAREDSYLKPFFPVESLQGAREAAAQHGGRLRPAEDEWGARGFRACEGVDPDGNVIQCREWVS